MQNELILFYSHHTFIYNIVMRTVAIDYGTKRIGLAISDPTGLVAKPMPTLKVKSFADAVGKVFQIIKKQQADTIILGLPLSPKREETQQSIQIRYFAQALRVANNIKIEYWNESFSTIDAEKSISKGTKRKRKNIDSEAARIILQEYLDYKRNPESKPQIAMPHYDNILI